MTACDHVRPELGGYVLGALEPDEAEAVREHLAHCAACAAEHAGLAGLPPLLALAEGLDETPPLAPAMEERVLDAVARERAASPDPRRRPRARPRPRALLAGAAAVAAAAVIALAIGVIGGGEESAPAYDVALRPVAGGSASGHAELSGSAGRTTLHCGSATSPPTPTSSTRSGAMPRGGARAPEPSAPTRAVAPTSCSPRRRGAASTTRSASSAASGRATPTS